MSSESFDGEFNNEIGNHRDEQGHNGNAELVAIGVDKVHLTMRDIAE